MSEAVTPCTEEVERLRFQNGTSNPGRGGCRYLPYAFTEHGAIMAATVLNSSHAVGMSVFVVRAFVKMREQLMASAKSSGTFPCCTRCGRLPSARSRDAGVTAVSR